MDSKEWKRMRDASQKKFGPSGISSQISRLVIVESDLYGRFFGKSWRSLEFLPKCRVFSRCQGIFENKSWREWNFSTSLPSIDSMERDL